MSRWRDRVCTCRHPRSIHADGGPGWTPCEALRCPCPIWDAAWAARFWARLLRLR